MSRLQASLVSDVPEHLREVVRAVTGEPNAVLDRWSAAPLTGGFGGLAGRSELYRLAGTARVSSDERDWEAVLKVLTPAPERNDPSDELYWKREALLYGSGVLDALPPGVRAPRGYGVHERADGSVWLWLEHVREDGHRHWPLARWALAARHLGRFNGAYLAGHPLPVAPFLGPNRLRAWLNHHHPQVSRIAAAPDHPELRQWWPRAVVDAILQLWEEREGFCAALEALPRTFGHGDAIRRNLFARRAPDGSEETVAIDWEHAGYYAAGEEVGQTLSVAAAFSDLEPSDLPALDEALFASYLDGLREAGWRGDPRPVRFAYVAHAALRNLFNAVGASLPDDARRAEIRQNHGHTWEELAERRAAIRPFLLKLADEARTLEQKC